MCVRVRATPFDLYRPVYFDKKKHTRIVWLSKLIYNNNTWRVIGSQNLGCYRIPLRTIRCVDRFPSIFFFWLANVCRSLAIQAGAAFEFNRCVFFRVPFLLRFFNKSWMECVRMSDISLILVINYASIMPLFFKNSPSIVRWSRKLHFLIGKLHLVFVKTRMFGKEIKNMPINAYSKYDFVKR